uniref:Uncharacterized protein n=1 Tax=Siphoviridae sp. ctLNL10 TaxID=2825453 RepID=A0A8S5Q5N9_9CAUD|nr:MAG TPA: hypothetical protein [Siphoviridae sp. ctLNL10]
MVGNTHGVNLDSVYFLGAGTSFNIKSKFPNDYKKFTNQNFMAGGTVNISNGDNNSGTGYASGTVSCSYNQSSGVLTVSNGGCRSSAPQNATVWGAGSFNPKVWMCTGKIKPI